MNAVGLSNCSHSAGQLAVAESLGRSLYRCRPAGEGCGSLGEVLVYDRGIRKVRSGSAALGTGQPKVGRAGLRLLTPVHKATSLAHERVDRAGSIGASALR